MSKRKLCGYDLNGWSDRAARNWRLGPDGEEAISPDGCFVSGAVLNPVIVQTGKDRQARWVGGAQAALAPHGRGGGWGNVGDRARRKSLRDLLGAEDVPTDQLAAGLAGLATGARVCAVAIDDHPSRSESLQEHLLAAIAKGRLGRGLLVWRSVLAVLGALGKDQPLSRIREGLTVGVIGHVAEGFTFQRLKMRREAGQGRDVFAPERRRPAEPIVSAMGYAGLQRQARQILFRLNPDLRGDWTDHALIPAALALGHPVSPELVRNDRGDFFLVRPPDEALVCRDDLQAGLSGPFDGCDILLLESLAQGSLRASILAAIADRCELPVLDLPSDIVARGALEAARRHAEGEPVCFDFLPQISTVVWGEDGASSYDLIEADETLPAGRIYRSPKPARLAIQGGQSQVSVFIRKEAADWPRKAIVDIGQKVGAPIPVSLSVEQAPAAGRAQLIIDAPDLSRQFTVNWDAAEEIRKPWEEVIAELDVPAATIPSRMILPCGVDAWVDSPKGLGLASLLNENCDREDVDWRALAGKLSQRPQGRYCISSDGDVPAGIPADLLQKLDQLAVRALEDVQRRIAGKVSDDNESLKFLTWQFRRCPEALQEILIETLNTHATAHLHPLIVHPMSWTLIFQGFGRICRDARLERMAFDQILRRPVTRWSYKQETAAAAFLLSRSDSAPLLLARSEIEQLVSRVLIEFREELGGNYTKFTYAPFLLGGLIRWRLRDRNALVLGLDPLAHELQTAIHDTIEDFSRKRNRNETFLRAASRYTPLLSQLLDELQGRGGNPDLLLNLYEA